MAVTILLKDHYPLASLALQFPGYLLGVGAALIRADIDPVERVAARRWLLGIGAEILPPKLSGQPVCLLRRAKSRNVDNESRILVFLGRG